MKDLNEGFWDAVVNKAKMVVHQAGAAMGSGESAGKLNARNLATDLYNEFKLFKGSTGLKTVTADDMAEFMAGSINMSDAFAKRCKVEFETFLTNPEGYRARGGSTPPQKPAPDQTSKTSESINEESGQGFSDAALRNYFLAVAQAALRTGEALSAARDQRGVSDTTPEPASKDAPAQAKSIAQPGSKAAQAQAATQNNSPAPEKDTVDLHLPSLSDQQQDLLDKLTDQVGVDGLGSFITAKDPEVEQLAKRILKASLSKYVAAREAKQKK